MGTIVHGHNNFYHPDKNSLLYTMNISVIQATTITFKLFAVDNNVYIYIDNVQADSSSIYSSRTSPKTLSFSLTPGEKTIQIVKNDEGGDNAFELMGDIISSTVKFNG
jgi:hypothetical protein